MRNVAITCTVLAAGLMASSPLNAGSAPLPPPYQGIYQPQGVDEAGLWREDDENERQLAASPIVINDEELRSYIKRVLCDTVGHDRCDAVRIYVLREPTFNATMSPNGSMRVYSGLLLRVHSEAELGAVLGHEFGHFEKRHGLAAFKAARSSTDILAWGAVLASMSASYQTYRSYRNLELSVYGHFFQYKRNQEREADYLGVGYLNASKFRPQAASQVWQNFMGELEASAQVRGLKKPKFNTIAFTASHPPEAERATYLAEMALPGMADRDDGVARYSKALDGWIPQFLEDQVKLNDFGASEYIIEQLAQDGWTADLWLARGELYRTRGNQRDLTHAAEFYANAVASDPALGAAYRGLGLTLMKVGQQSAATAALRRYLELVPEASDAKMIRLLVPQEGTGQ